MNTLSYTIPNLIFADLNGDGKTDVMHVGNSQWRVSWGGTSPLYLLQHSNIIRSDIAIGDFDGDDVADIFIAGCF